MQTILYLGLAFEIFFGGLAIYLTAKGRGVLFVVLFLIMQILLGAIYLAAVAAGYVP